MLQVRLGLLLGILLIGCGGKSGTSAFTGSHGSDQFGFLAGTMISTPDGVRANNNFKPRDQVLAFDLETQVVVATDIERSFIANVATVLKLTLANGTSFNPTAKQLVYSVGAAAFVPAEQLVVGDAVKQWQADAGESTAEITAIATIDVEDPVYNLRSRTYGTYFADGVLVRSN